MSRNKTVYKMDRRDLLKWMGVGGALTMMNFGEAMAAGECESATPDALASAIANAVTLSADGAADAKGELFYWIDGRILQPFGSTMGMWAKMAVAIDLPHTAASFVEGVYLTDASNKIIASRRLEASDAASGKAPYVIFDNLMFENVDHSIYFFVRSGNDYTIYRHVIAKENLRESRLDYSHLSAEARNKIPGVLISDMEKSYHCFLGTSTEVGGYDSSLGFGYLTTPFHSFAPIPPHRVRARIQSIEKDGHFKMTVMPMHQDESELHYMRYFLVLDPVGRVLGCIKRPWEASNAGKLAAPQDVIRGVTGAEFGSFDGSLLNISDCPYIQVITEDSKDAIARMTIRLR